jgi:hypothetical protein
LIDTALDVDFGKLIKLELGVLAQLLALAREIGLLGIGLGAAVLGVPAKTTHDRSLIGFWTLEPCTAPEAVLPRCHNLRTCNVRTAARSIP